MGLQFSSKLSKSFKGIIIFLLISLLGTVVYFFYVLPLLRDQVTKIFVDPMEFRIRSFGFDIGDLEVKERKDFVYRELPTNPFSPLESIQEDIYEEPMYYFTDRVEIPFILTGIVGGTRGRLAIIEGDRSSYILRVGDTFRGFKVLEIRKNEVLVSDEWNLTYSLYLGGGYGERL